MTDRPWMTALEMQLAAQKNCRAVIAGDAVRQRDHTAFRAAAGETYAWSAETVKAVGLASKSIPGASRLTVQVSPSEPGAGWWWFDSPALLIEAPAFTLRIHALLFALEFGIEADFPSSLYFRAFVKVPRQPLGAWISWGVGINESIDEFAKRESRPAGHTGDPAMIALTRFYLAGSAWLQQRVVSTGIGNIERHRRKQLQREHDQPLPSEIKVIQLRRSESQPHLSIDGAQGVDWSCRWVVSGHWRNRPDASGDRRLIFIMPYVKGPSDKPLRIPKHTVYSVDR